MKVILFGDESEKCREMVEKAGFKIVGPSSDPDYIITFGGDGTLMRSETAYPGVPKVMLRNSVICKKCSLLSNEEVLERVAKKKFNIEKLMKLECEAKGVVITAVNDVIVHNKNPRHGIRYNISIHGKSLNKEIIGDGVVLATPFGSSAYYRSITDSYIEVGIGLAFNNSTEQADHIVLKEDSVVTLTVTRGPAEVFADNDPVMVELGVGDTVMVKKSRDFAQLVVPHVN